MGKLYRTGGIRFADCAVIGIFPSNSVSCIEDKFISIRDMNEVCNFVELEAFTAWVGDRSTFMSEMI